MKKMLLVLIVSIVLLIFFTGVEPKQLEKQGLITAVGYDLAEENNFLGTATLLKFSPNVEEYTATVEAKGHTSKAIRMELNRKTSHNLVSGQLRVAVYGKELAQKGIENMIDSLRRDANIGNMVYLIVSETTANELLKTEIENSGNMGIYLYNLLKQNIKVESIISNTLQEYMHFSEDVGRDMVLPVLATKDGRVEISGMGVFHEDKLVDTLNIDKTFYLKVLLANYNAGAIELKFPIESFKDLYLDESFKEEGIYTEHVFLTIDNISSKKNLSLTNKETPKFEVDVQLKVRILEATENIDFGKKETITEIEKKINQEIEKNIKDLLKTLQELKVDPVGFGNVYQAHSKKKLTPEKWDKIYANAQFDINIDTNVVRTGVID